LDGAGNSSNSQGNIQVAPGDRLPLMPRHMLKAYADLRATRKLTLDLGLNAISSSIARGNENNLHQPDGVYFLGPGRSPGYSVMNLGGRYQVHPHVQLFVQVNNLLDHHYYTAAQLGSTGFTAQGTFIARPLPAVGGQFPVVNATFYAPGAPIGAWAGIRVSF
jgi:outer membrane receptor for ferric coprogen and ferric-rhodotorulic acid